MTRNVSLAAALAALALLAGTASARIKTAKLGKEAPDFTLTDSSGQKRTLSDYKDKVVVLEWLNYDCPFVGKHYKSKNMQNLQSAYTGKGVVWFSIISSRKGKQGAYSADEVNKKNEEREGRATAILLDPDGTVGHLYDAKTTPHMFVIDKGVLKYAGAIDDKPTTDLDDVPTAHNYVSEALDAVLSGQKVPVTHTKSYGCSVKY